VLISESRRHGGTLRKCQCDLRRITCHAVAFAMPLVLDISELCAPEQDSWAIRRYCRTSVSTTNQGRRTRIVRTRGRDVSP